MKGHPDISVQVTVTGTNQVLASVANGEADIGLAYNPAQYAGVRSVVVSRQPLCAIVHPAHPFADRPGLALRDLAEESVAFLPSTHGVRQLIGRVEADQGFRLAPRMESGSVDVLCRYVLAAMGMTVLPCFAVAEYLASRRLSAIPLSDGLLGEACTHLLVRAYRRLPAPVERLVSILSTQVPAFKADGFRQMLPGEQRAFSKLLL
jgi:DNA-binding transcriptional LysR family regulator